MYATQYTPILLLASMMTYFVTASFRAPPSPIYIDNGHDQTEIEREMTPLEKNELETEILNLLGLESRPQPRVTLEGGGVGSGGGVSMNRSAPKFLLDIYNSLAEKDNDEDEDEGEDLRRRSGRRIRSTDSDKDDRDEVDKINLSGEEKRAIDLSDIIMTFENKRENVNEVRHERGKRLWFNVSEVPIAENILGAELRVFQKQKTGHPNTTYDVTIYQLINTNTGERELEEVTKLETNTEHVGWLEFNLTSCLGRWVAFPDSNKGIYISVHPSDRPGHEIRPEEVGLVTRGEEDEAQPFMVAFLKAVNHVKVPQKRRSTREIVSRRVKKSQYTSTTSARQFYNSGLLETWKTCKMHTLYISFKDLQWQDWILAPEGYAAYYCAGECKFPLNGHMNATNHAIVQTLVHLMNPLKIPKPCCAPTKLSAISVLYFLDDTNVILKKYKKMAVKSCGCH